jgi:sortase A
MLAGAAWHGGRAAWSSAKARLAQALLGQAWRATLAGVRDVRPWPWADTSPVARLLAPAQAIDLLVLAGASGRTLAFGPGHLSGTPLPGEAGNSVVSGHRDTHFAFLQRLREGDVLVVERRDGTRRRYTVAERRVVDRSETWVVGDSGDTRLTLVTCYPFDAIRPGGPLRFVVTATLEPIRDTVLTGAWRGSPRGSPRSVRYHHLKSKLPRDFHRLSRNPLTFRKFQATVFL